ncbi:MAG: molybdenum ABC transporter ATP-binding protein [Planctomycetota bacterium]|nr:MAG: molybdenum ABC transporter ATP-binding protein [Planctomycetota bacterium]
MDQPGALPGRPGGRRAPHRRPASAGARGRGRVRSPACDGGDSGAAALLEVSLRHAFPRGFGLDLDFAAPGRALGIFGPSGSGKSTVLRAVAGLFRPGAGRVRLRGRLLLDTDQGVFLPPRRRRVGYVVQDGLLFPLLDVRQNLLFGAPRRGGRLGLDEVARLLDLEHLLGRMPRNLSGGERQRVALGRAVLSEPEVLLCDEPFSALEASRRRRLVPSLHRLCVALGLPLVFVSHSVEEVLSLCDHVVVLDAGRVVASGTLFSVLEELAREDSLAANVWEGDVVAGAEAAGTDSELREVRVAPGVSLYAPLPDAVSGARARLALPPSAVTVLRRGSKEEAARSEQSSARNQLAGTVVEVSALDEGVRVRVDAGVPVTARVSTPAAAGLGLVPGAPATVSFKAHAVRVLRGAAVGPPPAGEAGFSPDEGAACEGSGAPLRPR